MSSLLYWLGGAAIRRRGVVLACWLAIVAALGSSAALLQQGTENSFEIPDAQSQQALNHLSHVFPQMSGSAAQLVASAPPGQRIDAPAANQTIEGTIENLKGLNRVSAVMNPLDTKTRDFVSQDGRSAIIMVQVNVDPASAPPQTKNALLDAAKDLRTKLGPGSEAHVGGDLFALTVPSPGVTEALGVAIALLVLLVMLRSLVAATMPLITAIIGVGVSGALVLLATAITPVSSAAPMLGIMLGLAVGIDYSLFILSRHRDYLAQGTAPAEAAARAVATAGSAVIFAGITVIIALLALAVPGLPFLTTMGVLAGVSIAIGVAVALTLIPALLGFAGNRLRPGRQRAAKRDAQPKGNAAGRSAASADASPRRRVKKRKTLSLRWVRAATKAPLVTILIVIAGLGICALPAKDLHLALPDSGAQTPGTPARDTYNAITEHFGPGYNSPLIVITDVIDSKDPLGKVNGMAAEIREVPGVAAVPLATPNEKIDTGLIQVIPTTAGDSPQTQQLVHRLREMSGHFEHKYGSGIAITGMTAIGVDLSRTLSDALLPFGTIVVGLSLILLVMVFRSIWVPIKAAAGYLLSVGATLGVISFVFVQGHLAGPLGLTHVGSVVNFLPIMLMGILFGLAMDYEVFLVSRMREEYAHHGHPRHAVEAGFTAVSPVVVSAAVIMIAVFAAFVPHGDSNIKPIALGLAFGVFVDAFIVRMTLVPAVMTLLGRHAWWLPNWIARRLPELDVEGSALLREIRLADWPAGGHDTVVAAEKMRLADDRGRALFDGVDVWLRRGEVLGIHGGGPKERSALLYSLGGRVAPSDGDLKVLGRVLPQHARAVRRRSALIPCRESTTPARDAETAVADGVRLILLDDLDAVVPEQRAAFTTLLSGLATSDGQSVTVAFTCANPSLLAGIAPPDKLVALPMPSETDEYTPARTRPLEV